METKGWLIKLKTRGILDEKKADGLIDELTQVHKMLNSYIKFIGNTNSDK